MGVISRKIFPACGRMCVCCPALRSRSRQPVKRYKKLLADIFPKSPDAPPSDRKIVKLCEYATKNPFRIPKIVKYLEERCYKELRGEHIKFLSIIMEVYNKLLCMCKEQMAYFAISLLSVVTELLDNGKREAVGILGCQTLTAFIYNLTDASYSHNIEKFIPKVCKLACEKGGEQQRIGLRASSLQCLSAMVWFMVEFSYIFDGIDEIVQVTLDNYEPDVHNANDDERHHNWVDEVVRSEGRVGGDNSPISMVIRPRPEKKDPSLLTREEIETPKIWAQICIQRMAELTKESSVTMRRVLDPMFVYFDMGCHWLPRQGLALVVLCDLAYMVDRSGNQELILASVIRHLDHKNISHDSQLKACIIRVATTLVRQIRLGAALKEFGFVTDLCRHLRRSLQANIESGRDLNHLLQNSIEDCLLEVAKGITDPQPLCDMMAIALEKLPSAGVVARATIGSLTVVAHMISLVLISSHRQQAFPEALLIHLLRAMLHSDVEARVGSHQIFSILLIANSSRHRYEVSSLRGNCLYEPRWQSCTASALASITARLEKLRKEKNGIILENVACVNKDDLKGTDSPKEEQKQGCVHKSSPNLYNITTGLSEEPYTLKLTEDQIAQLLSAFWIQATLPDNLPTNFEAIAHSYALTILSSRMMCPSSNLVMCFFHLPLSLRNISLDPYNGALPAACQRSLFTLSMSMLLFAARIYQIMLLIDLLKSSEEYDVDPYLGIAEDMQLFIRPQVNVREYGSAKDSQMASSLLLDLRNKASNAEKIVDVLGQNLSSIVEVAQDDIAKQLVETFTPDDALVLGPRLMHDLGHNQTILHFKKFSFDEDFSANSSIEDDMTSEASVADLSRFIPKIPSTPSLSNIISIGQLMESALQVAGQVAGTTVSSSPLPYDTMASQCEALGTGQRRKLSTWLAHENCTNTAEKPFPSVGGLEALRKITSDDGVPPLGGMRDRCLTMKLPPASPFDNFLKAAGC